MHDRPPPQTSEMETGAFGKALKIIAYPFSVLVGGLYAHTSVRDASYKNLRNLGAFSEAQRDFDKAKNLLPPPGVTKDITKELAVFDAAYSSRVDKRFYELGYKNMWDRFKNLHRYQQFETALAFATAAGITLGVVLTIADNKSLWERLSSPKPAPDEKGHEKISL